MQKAQYRFDVKKISYICVYGINKKRNRESNNKESNNQTQVVVWDSLFEPRLDCLSFSGRNGDTGKDRCFMMML